MMFISLVWDIGHGALGPSFPQSLERSLIPLVNRPVWLQDRNLGQVDRNPVIHSVRSPCLTHFGFPGRSDGIRAVRVIQDFVYRPTCSVAPSEYERSP